MSLKVNPYRLLAAAASLALLTTLGGCEDPVRGLKNIGDYLNLRNSFLDPSQVGRFDKTMPWGFSKPVTWPILEQLDSIDEPADTHWTNATDPVPADLVAERKEYEVGEGDVIDVQVYELVTPGLPYERRTQVNELGKITLQNLGAILAAGLTPTQLEDKIGQLAVDKGFLLPKGNGSPGPQVSVQVASSQAKVYYVLGQASPGPYGIFNTDFRLLEALAQAHDITGGTQVGMDYLYVIRPNKGAGIIPAAGSTTEPATEPATGGNTLETLDKIGNTETKPATMPGTAPATTPGTVPGLISAAPRPAVDDGPKFLRELPPLPPSIVTLTSASSPVAQVQGELDAAINGSPATGPATMRAAATMPAETAPAGGMASTIPATMPAEDMMSQIVGGTGSKPGMIYVDGRWVEVQTPTSTQNMNANEAMAAATGITPPRVIRIPIDKLKEGDPNYNIIIRPGDIINVPNIVAGEFYLYGHVGHAGVYSLTGRKVTLKQAIAASGGLDALAIPRRCDLVRRIKVGNTEVEITVQVDLQRIFDGEEPDIYLKPNDWVNVGSDLVAPFLAVIRNAYRAAYGWGFTYDRNLYNQPVITQTGH